MEALGATQTALVKVNGVCLCTSAARKGYFSRPPGVFVQIVVLRFRSFVRHYGGVLREHILVLYFVLCLVFCARWTLALLP